MEKKCETCGGSGQIGHFPGVSRFVICWEECPECLGSGLQENESDTEKNSRPSPGTTMKTDDGHRS